MSKITFDKAELVKVPSSNYKWQPTDIRGCSQMNTGELTQGDREKVDRTPPPFPQTNKRKSHQIYAR